METPRITVRLETYKQRGWDNREQRNPAQPRCCNADLLPILFLGVALRSTVHGEHRKHDCIARLGFDRNEAVWINTHLVNDIPEGVAMGRQ
jgi:hypothetical protein